MSGRRDKWDRMKRQQRATKDLSNVLGSHRYHHSASRALKTWKRRMFLARKNKISR